MEKITVFRTLYSHSGAIYDMQYIPNAFQVGIQQNGIVENAGEEDSRSTTVP